MDNSFAYIAAGYGLALFVFVAFLVYLRQERQSLNALKGSFLSESKKT